MFREIKVTLTLPLFALLSVCFFACSARAKYGGGSGTPEDPYQIWDANHMQAIGADANDWDKHFKLMADIDLREFTGTSFNIIGANRDNPFKGVFDGNNHTISYFTYDSNDKDNIGLFGYIDDPNSEIKNLGLIDPNINAGTWDYVGSLVGDFIKGTITNCYVDSGSVAGYNVVGGLVGWNGGTITISHVTASVSGNLHVGGLVGWNAGTKDQDDAAYIFNSYSTGSVDGHEHVGGLVGDNGACRIYSHGGYIINCYSTGSVSADYHNYLGGLVGSFECGEVTASFWDIETSGQDRSDGGIGLPTDQMQMQSTFIDAGWDFVAPTWTIDEGVDYPRLWCEFAPVLHAEPEVTLGTSNTVSWEPVVGEVEYYAECAEDENFTSIVHTSGWITDTNCIFAGLEMGKVYWYSVKARNAEGTESQWSNVEFSFQLDGTLADAVEIMLNPESLKNENMRKALLNKINMALELFNEGLNESSWDKLEKALDKLENDILSKMDGCAETGEPDKNDWIVTCEGQSQIYPLVIETIEYLRSLLVCWPYPPECCIIPDYGC